MRARRPGAGTGQRERLDEAAVDAQAHAERRFLRFYVDIARVGGSGLVKEAVEEIDRRGRVHAA